MDLGIAGRTALVTGASRGIGRAIAETLAREGCHLHLAARDADRLHAAAREIADRHGVRVQVHQADLAQRGAHEALVAVCADADILVNNAGAVPRGDILEVDEETWRSGWELKVFGYIAMTRAMYARMAERGAGVIVNVIGIGGEKLEYAYAAGSTGNAALMAMTRAVGSGSIEHGVRILGVNPGWVETDRSRASLGRRAQQELGDVGRWRELVKDWPRGALIQPQEIADVVAFCASARASALSGVIVTVDAGFSARGYPLPKRTA
ncbi:short-chain dehydrogenase/reductase [Roseomonas sp. AR75]|uniref:short-chain dehydrogenase/reductase n=1 Tax=Roseomonas sp. AR75 TaxID=2562311 RepID=UPI0010C0E9A7|nr:short-chain dehydrogenase/reductase [Roseomonas sp. AR75]